MTKFAQQLSHAIRILRGNRDESARASHLVVNKGRFVINESEGISQAEREKCSQSTFFERKIMSTKTAFKRIALVAAAALAIGGISAVSAQATGTSDWIISNALAVGGSGNAETATQVAGVANYVTLTAVPETVVAPNTYGGIYFTVSGGMTTTGTTSGTVLGSGAVNIATPAVGTVTVTSYQITNGAASGTATSATTITVQASIPGTLYASSNVYASSSGVIPATAGTDATYTSVTAPANGSAVAQFSVAEVDANGVSIAAANAKGITVTSTNGLVSSQDLLVAPVANTTYISGTPVNAVSHFILSSINGLPGASTVSISVNGVVVKTYTATFTGAAVKIVLTAINNVIAVGAPAGVTANTNALEVQEFDASGNAVAANTGTITLTSASTAIATAGGANTAGGLNTLGNITGGKATSTSVVGYSLNGVTAGTTTFTATDSTGTLTSLPVSVRVSSGMPTMVVYTTDLATYPAGGAGTLTVTLSDAAGTVPAGSYAVLTGTATSSLAFAVAPSNLVTPVVVNDMGVSTSAFNAPLSDGTVTVTGTASATTIVVTPAVFTTASGASSAANAAVDAANEATDAANAATDAANAAADSADAATQAAQDAGDKADAALAAVVALSQQVTNVLAKVAALSALLVRIIKKTHA